MAPVHTAFPFPKDLFLKFVQENNGEMLMLPSICAFRPRPCIAVEAKFCACLGRVLSDQTGGTARRHMHTCACACLSGDML